MNTSLFRTAAIKGIAILLVFALATGNLPFASAIVVSAQSVQQPSHNVAVVDSLVVRNGGTFPTTTSGPTGSFSDFHFFMLPRANVSLTTLGPGGICGADGCDTVLLNVASPGMACNTSNLTTNQKVDLVNFVSTGRKLIIYDSECVTQDYSWLPYPFTTKNPGQLGAQGTLTIVEENTLSSSDPTSPYYINTAALGTQTDAVGDMNVMTTFDPNWFLDMSGTNAIAYTGPVHTYAPVPPGTDKGLIIYNGLDMDYLGASTAPNSATAAGNLAKIWLQELQQLFNPSDLPGTNPVIGIALTPKNAAPFAGEAHTVTASLTDLIGNPQPGIQVTFSVTSGPNAGTSGICNPPDCKSDANGQVNFTYFGLGGVGTDQIRGCFTNSQGQTFCSQSVDAQWLPAGPCSGGASLANIDFKGGFPSVNYVQETLMYRHSISYNFSLTGKACPEAPLRINPGSDPSFTLETKSGEFSMHQNGLFETKIPFSNSKTYIGSGVLPNPPTVWIDNTYKYKVDISDFALEEESETRDTFSPRSLRIQPAYIVEVGVIVAVIASVALIPPPGGEAVALALLVLYVGPINPKPPTPAVSSLTAVNYQIESATPQQTVIDDLTKVYGPEFMSFTSVESLTIDAQQKGPGQNINFNGTNFMPDGYVYLLLTSPDNQNSKVESVIRADSNGAISGQIQLPTNASPGRWLLSAVDVSSMYYAIEDWANGNSSALQYFLAANTVTIPEYNVVTIDVKPNEIPNAINPSNLGVIPVAILTTPSFNATTIDYLSVRFGPNGATEVHKVKHIEDVDGDGDQDLVLHFDTQKSGIVAGDTQVCLIGKTKKGTTIVGCDTINTVPQ